MGPVLLRVNDDVQFYEHVKFASSYFSVFPTFVRSSFFSYISPSPLAPRDGPTGLCCGRLGTRDR